MHDPEINKALALFVMRTVAGVLFFMQAYDRLFHVKVGGVMDAFGESVSEKIASKRFKRSFIILLSYAELTGGLLLILGLFKEVALDILDVDLLLAAISFSIMKPMWDMQYYFPRLVLIIALLLLPKEWDVLNIDYLLKI